MADQLDKSKVSSSVLTMAALVGAPGGLMTKMASGILRLVGSARERGVSLQDDETFQENVDWIKRVVGDDCHIERDLPAIHEHVGLNIGDTKLLIDIDAAMKAGMVSAVKAVKKKQEESGGFISWKELTNIFESDGAALYRPCIEEDKTNSEHAWEDTGLYLKFDTAPDLAALAKAEECMKKTVDNADIWDMLAINQHTIMEVFGEQGVAITGLDSVIARDEKRARIAIDVGVVRFPRIEDPCFKVYRFRVIVFRSETAVTFINKKCAGIFCEFRERKYVMTKQFTEKFDEQTSKKVNEAFEDVMADFLRI